MSNFIGPVLPPDLNADSSDKDPLYVEAANDSHSDTDADVEIGPNILLNTQRHPQLPRKEAAQSEMLGNIADNGAGKISSSFLDEDNSDGKESSDVIGPLLPPGLRRDTSDDKISTSKTGPSLPLKLRSKYKTIKNSDSSDDEMGVIGPVLPAHLQSANVEDSIQQGSVNIHVIGPRLPAFLRSKVERQLPQSARNDSSKGGSIIGPSLPPHLQQKRDEELPVVVEDTTVDENPTPVIGPALPPHGKLASETADDEEDGDADVYGPALPPGFSAQTRSAREEEAESDDDIVGPLPEGASSGNKVQHRLELRARQLRETLGAEQGSASDAPTQRESWMLELPEDRAPELGLRSRQFRMREGPEAGDRSVWTDTPADREKKKYTPKCTPPDRGALDRLATQERDEKMQHLAEQHGSKRGSRSLLELHEEKQEAKRKKAEKAGEVQERRPFSRDVDLQVNRFDEAQKRSILKKAQHLNDRFSSGQSKFL